MPPRCAACLDTGRCGVCDGTGQLLQPSGLLRPCHDCRGSGTCNRCPHDRSGRPD